jgi:GntR family transcriptional regulator
MGDDRIVMKGNELVPLYHRLAAAIKDSIVNGRFKEGEYLPSEAQLMEMLGISRTTVRQAIMKLCQDGLLERQRGKGTVVKRQKLMREFPGWSSFTEETKRMGKRPGTVVISLDVVDPPAGEVASMLQLSPRQKVIYLLRKRYADEELLGVSESYFSKEHWDAHGIEVQCPSYLDNRSIYEFLEERGIELIWAQEWIEAGIASERLSELLGTPPGTPMLYLTRLVYGRDDAPVEYAINRFRADKYRISIVHKRYNEDLTR